MLTVHWRAPLQPKGFLKIVELLVAILAFSLVAGYTINSSVTCTDQVSSSINVQSKYPFFVYDRSVIIGDVAMKNESQKNEPFSQHIISGQFFVAWGVLTMLYCIVAIVVYMLFTANENLERVVDMLIYIDLGFHIVWVLGWFIASVDWAVGFNRIRGMMNDILTASGVGTCSAATITIGDPSSYSRQPDTFVQASIADVFGWLSLFLWAANVYWVLIDTAWFIQWKAKRAQSQY